MAQGKKLNCKVLSNGIEYEITTKHPVYNLRYTIMTRCYNASQEDYPFYQGRGIKVCPEWISNPLSFFQWCFDNGWQKSLVLDRIDNNKDYEPSNCRFVDNTFNLKKMHIDNNLIGENAPNAKLTLQNVLEIKKLLEMDVRYSRLAKDFGVSASTIGAIKRKQNWKDV